MPLSTNSDAFRSPKNSVCKFDDFDCPQLYLYLGNLSVTSFFQAATFSFSREEEQL